MNKWIRKVGENVTFEVDGKEVGLPSYFDYDLDGFRGYKVERFPLVIEEKDGKYVGHYSHDGAECGLACQCGNTKGEVVVKLLKEIKEYQYIK